MKRCIYPTLLMIMALVLLLMLMSAPGFGQTTYTISTNENWSSSLPTTCFSCTIRINTGVTLTIDKSVTCQNCAFQGGAMTMNNHTLNLQYSGALTTTNFNNTSLTVLGTSGQVTVNAPISLSNSVFTFKNASSMTTSYEVDLSASDIYLNDNSSMTANGLIGTPLKLMHSSQIVIGNGSKTSTAQLTVSGPLMDIYDNSFVTVANTSNGYYNWLGYEYYSSTASTSPIYHNTLNNQMNCGSGFPQSCALDAAFGPSMMSSGGLVPGNTLPVVLDGFTAVLNSDKTVALTWETRQEMNSADFTIERSADGEDWENIGTVRAQGNSTSATDYSFTDEHPVGGTNFYRLQMVDIDNSFAYSDVKVVRTSVINQVTFFPNPARDYVNVSLGGATATTDMVAVRLINLSGRVMQEQRVAPAPGTIV
ncbi:MAG TPA: hypothetical protein VNU70_09120, partial [Puia sp.]|nr:hypothetical protein [Puia sp.]